MFEHLRGKGIERVREIYGSKEQKKIAHVFHLDILSDMTRKCNEAQCDFFRKHVG